MGMASFNAMRRRQAEEAKKAAKPRANAAPDVWAVMRAGRDAALKLFKGSDHKDPEAAAQTYIDEIVAGGSTPAEELSKVKRD